MTTREARTLLASDCPRLDAELAILRAMAHTGKGARKRRKKHHRAWCPTCNPRAFRVPDGLPRERTP